MGGSPELCALTIAPTLSIWVRLTARGFHESLDPLSPQWFGGETEAQREDTVQPTSRTLAGRLRTLFFPLHSPGFSQTLLPSTSAQVQDSSSDLILSVATLRSYFLMSEHHASSSLCPCPQPNIYTPITLKAFPDWFTRVLVHRASKRINDPGKCPHFPALCPYLKMTIMSPLRSAGFIMCRAGRCMPIIPYSCQQP